MKHASGLCAPLMLVLGLVVASAAPAPSFLGPTGLLRIPTTDTLAERQLSTNFASFEEANTQAYAFNYGVRDGLEVGFTRTAGPETTINGKYAYRKESMEAPGLAFGVLDLTGQQETTLYGVVSRPFITRGTNHLTNVRGFLGLGTGGALNGVFAGGSAVYGRRALLMLEYDTQSINGGVRYTTPEGIVAQLGITGSDHEFTWGVGYVKQF